MPRLIKRYGSRKLYDTEESRYVSLEELASWIRDGQQLQVIDNKSGDDATASVLTQIISEEGRKGTSPFSGGFLHDLIRIGENTLKAGEEAVGKARAEASSLMNRSIEKIKSGSPASDMKSEMTKLRARLDALEASLEELDDETES